MREGTRPAKEIWGPENIKIHPASLEGKSKHGISPMGLIKDSNSGEWIAYLPTSWEETDNGRLLLKEFTEMKMDNPEEVDNYMRNFYETVTTH